MSINISSILNNIYDGRTQTKKSTNTNTNSNVNSDNIFAQASALVAEFKSQQENKDTSSASKGVMGGLSLSQAANMSTSEFLNYAYNNKADSNFKSSSEDSSGVDLPLLVSYKGRVVSTAGKSFMQVVAKLAAKFPKRTEEEIAAELMTKYGKFDEQGNLIKNNTATTAQASGQANKLDLSA